MDFLVPKLSATMELATVRKWLKKPGERVKMGEALVEIETDKATIEVEAPADATVNTILAPEGAQLPIGGVLATLDAAGGAPTSPTSVPKAVALAPAASGPRLVAPAPQPVASPPRAASLPPRVFASPLARRLAAEHGLDLAALAGTGPHRRIRKRDVLAAASNQGRAPSSTRRPANATIAENGTGEAISQMRLRVAETVSVSRRTIPAFTLDRWVESTALHEARVAIGSLVEREVWRQADGHRLSVAGDGRCVAQVSDDARPLGRDR